MRGCDSVDSMINLWNKKKVMETRKDDRDGSLVSGDNNAYLRLGKKARAKRSGYECELT